MSPHCHQNMEQNNRVQEAFINGCKGKHAHIYGTNGEEWFGKIIDSDTFTYMVQITHFPLHTDENLKEGPEVLLLYKSGLVGIEVEMELPTISPATPSSRSYNKNQQQRQQQEQQEQQEQGQQQRQRQSQQQGQYPADTARAAEAVNDLKKMLEI